MLTILVYILYGNAFIFLFIFTRMEEEYTLESGSYSFKAVLNTVFREHDYVELQVGYLEDQGWCIQFEYYPESRPDKLNMVSVMHNRKCSIEENLENGLGTRIMLKVALSFAFKLFPKVKHIHFHDTSSILSPTGNHPNKVVFLPIIKMIQEQKTWYQKYFHAKPLDDWSEAIKQIKEKASLLSVFTIDDYARKGAEIWKLVSPNKNIVYSEWFIERGANKISYKICKQKHCKPFSGGGYKRNGLLL